MFLELNTTIPCSSCRFLEINPLLFPLLTGGESTITFRFFARCGRAGNMRVAV